MSQIEYEILKIRFLILAHLHTLIGKFATRIWAKAMKIYKKMNLEEAENDRAENQNV